MWNYAALGGGRGKGLGYPGPQEIQVPWLLLGPPKKAESIDY